MFSRSVLSCMRGCLGEKGKKVQITWNVVLFSFFCHLKAVVQWNYITSTQTNIRISPQEKYTILKLLDMIKYTSWGYTGTTIGARWCLYLQSFVVADRLHRTDVAVITWKSKTSLVTLKLCGCKLLTTLPAFLTLSPPLLLSHIWTESVS